MSRTPGNFDEEAAALLPQMVSKGTLVATPNAEVKRSFAALGFDTDSGDERRPGAAALIRDELAMAGAHAERLLDSTVEALVPGGILALTLPSSLHSSATRSWHPTAVQGFLGARGVALDGLWAPGATAHIDQATYHFDPVGDADQSVLGAVPRLLAFGRAPASGMDRSAVFFDTLPGKTVAAATITQLTNGAMLVVHDLFKQHWTIPGGVVDANEDPEAAATRETMEEAGIEVQLTGLLGVFHGLRPDRLVLVFGARPRSSAIPQAVHTHEIDGAKWLDVGAAMDIVAPYVAWQIDRCLGHPGRVWRQH